MTNAIELSHIQKTFPQFALRDVSLAVPTGTICGLVGENGAGKSTLIRILMGALRPESGRAPSLAPTPPPRTFRLSGRTSAWCWMRGAFRRP